VTKQFLGLFFFFFIVDIAFADSHTIWAQHPSGTFSQLDVRQSSRPIDAIPRTSVSWEAGGGLAFVSGRKNRWEVPFDDVYAVYFIL
jgi:WD repeat-containing protein 24